MCGLGTLRAELSGGASVVAGKGTCESRHGLEAARERHLHHGPVEADEQRGRAFESQATCVFPHTFAHDTLEDTLEMPRRVAGHGGEFLHTHVTRQMRLQMCHRAQHTAAVFILGARAHRSGRGFLHARQFAEKCRIRQSKSGHIAVTVRATHPPTMRHFSPLLCVLCALTALPRVEANPNGEVVRLGSATFERTGNTLTITQSSQKAIIHWQDFSIGAGELTKFVQPGSNAAALNFVVGPLSSLIGGTLEANGSIYLINPNGIVVGPTGVINTGSFIASTRVLDDAQFLSGGDMKFVGKSAGDVINHGTITASTGDVMLIGRSVLNTGTIKAPNGTVGLAAGDEVLLKAAGDERLFVLAGSGGTAEGVTNRGTLEGAQAELKAAAGNAYALAINNEGTVNATKVSREGGRILLRAGGAKVRSSGTLKAKGKKGGKIQVLGGDIRLAKGSTTDASGDQGGGSVFIGGGQQGAPLNGHPNATTTTVEAGATIKADALQKGNGGQVIVWADDHTSFAGTISAQGGLLGGDGGFIEVSGKNTLEFQGTVLRGAPGGGRPGALLLDPHSVEVTSFNLDLDGDGVFNEPVADNPAAPPAGVGIPAVLASLADPMNLTDMKISGSLLDSLLAAGPVTIKSTFFTLSQPVAATSAHNLTIDIGSGHASFNTDLLISGGGQVALVKTPLGSVSYAPGVTVTGLTSSSSSPSSNSALHLFLQLHTNPLENFGPDPSGLLGQLNTAAWLAHLQQLEKAGQALNFINQADPSGLLGQLNTAAELAQMQLDQLAKASQAWSSMNQAEPSGPHGQLNTAAELAQMQLDQIEKASQALNFMNQAEPSGLLGQLNTASELAQLQQLEKASQALSFMNQADPSGLLGQLNTAAELAQMQLDQIEKASQALNFMNQADPSGLHGQLNTAAELAQMQLDQIEKASQALNFMNQADPSGLHGQLNTAAELAQMQHAANASTNYQTPLDWIMSVNPGFRGGSIQGGSSGHRRDPLWEAVGEALGFGKRAIQWNAGSKPSSALYSNTAKVNEKLDALEKQAKEKGILDDAADDAKTRVAGMPLNQQQQINVAGGGPVVILDAENNKPIHFSPEQVKQLENLPPEGDIHKQIAKVILGDGATDAEVEKWAKEHGARVISVSAARQLSQVENQVFHQGQSQEESRQQILAKNELNQGLEAAAQLMMEQLNQLASNITQFSNSVHDANSAPENEQTEQLRNEIYRARNEIWEAVDQCQLGLISPKEAIAKLRKIAEKIRQLIAAHAPRPRRSVGTNVGAPPLIRVGGSGGEKPKKPAMQVIKPY